MAGARQDNSLQFVMTSIFRKIDVMTDSIIKTNEDNFIILGDIKSIVQTGIQEELKKQTTILASINSKLTGLNNTRVNTLVQQNDSDTSSFGPFSKSFSILVKAANKLKPNTAEKVKVFLKGVAESFKELNSIDFSKSTNIASSIKTLLSIGDNILKFARNLIAFSIMSPLIKISLNVLKWTLSALADIQTPNKETTNNLEALVGLGGKIILFGLAMAGYAIIGIPATIGILLFAANVKLLNVLLSNEDTQKMRALDVLLKIGLGIVVFGIALVAFSMIAPQALTGAIIASIAVGILTAALLLAGANKLQDGVKNLAWIGLGLVSIAVGLFMFNLLVDPEKTISSLLVFSGVALVMALAGVLSTQINKGAKAMMLAAAPIAILTISLFIWQMADISLVNVLPLIAIVGSVALVMALAGVLSTQINKGSLSMMLASAPIVILTIAMIMWQTAGITWNSIGQVLAITGGVGILMGVAGLVAPYIALGAIAMGLSAVAILLMSVALSKFQTLNWTEKNSDNLKYTIKSVLYALSGTDEKKSGLANISSAVGQGLQAIMSLFSIGPLILGSAAIWLMSEALEKFKSVGWTPELSTSLTTTISGVLGALGNAKTISVDPGLGVLQTVLALIGAGTIFVAGAGIWLFSEALLKFKGVNWDTKKDNVALKGAMSGVVEALNDSVGLGDAAKAILKAKALSAVSNSLDNFFKALKTWKSLNWWNKDTAILKNAINMIFSFDNAKKFDGLQQAATNFRSIAGSMSQMKAHINALDIKKLTLTESMMKSIAALSKDPNAIAGTIRTSIEQAFAKMTEEMNKILTEVMTKNSNVIAKSISGIKQETNVSNTPAQNMVSTVQSKIPNTPNTTTKPVKEPEKPLNEEILAKKISAEFMKALSASGLRVIVNQDGTLGVSRF